MDQRTVASLTLPIQTQDGLYLDLGEARAAGERFADGYHRAEPFPHVVFDNFLPPHLADKILGNFPGSVNAGDKFYEAGYYGLHKRQISPNDCSEFNRSVFAFLNSSGMLQFIEGLTRIPGLLPDPYFFGGGFHEIQPGGLLGIHSDFRIHEELNLRRRINALIYLNRDWETSWGGQLELWDRTMKNRVQCIDPVFNRCVIFNTDERSFHGHPDPLNCPTGVSRKSIALYYYTASSRVRDEVQFQTTIRCIMAAHLTAMK
jgi:hypothetical protein